jgi:hypothetical protein
MNAIEIEEANSRLAESHFEPEEFPFFSLEAPSTKEATIKRLMQTCTNKSDVTTGVIQ